MNKQKTNHITDYDSLKETLRDIDIKYGGNILFQWSIANIPTSVDVILAKVVIYRNQQKKKHLSREFIMSYLLSVEHDSLTYIIKDFKETIRHVKGLPNKFEELSRLMTVDKYDPWYPILLYHVIWTFKRRLFGLDDYCPLFLNLQGDASAGKSECVKAMFSIVPSPIKSSVAIASELFDDERQSFRFVKNFVVTMDELAGLKDTDVCKLKNQIDSKVIVYRMLGYNKTCEGRNNAVLIGTSNKELRNIIHADTDARKWVEINMYSWPDKEVPAKMVTPLHQFDWLTLYRFVNEDGNSPFQDPDIYHEFRVWNTPRITTETPSVVYLKELIQNDGGEFISLRSAYEDYLNTVKTKQLGRANFKELLVKWGFEKHRKADATGYIIPKAFECKYMDEEDRQNAKTTSNIITNPVVEEDDNWMDDVKV